MIPEHIKNRYFRSVIAYPEGAVVHYADCGIYSMNICTCGLLKDLVIDTENVESIYPKFWSEWRRHVMIREFLILSDIPKTVRDQADKDEVVEEQQRRLHPIKRCNPKICPDCILENIFGKKGTESDTEG